MPWAQKLQIIWHQFFIRMHPSLRWMDFVQIFREVCEYVQWFTLAAWKILCIREAKLEPFISVRCYTGFLYRLRHRIFSQDAHFEKWNKPFQRIDILCIHVAVYVYKLIIQWLQMLFWAQIHTKYDANEIGIQVGQSFCLFFKQYGTLTVSCLRGRIRIALRIGMSYRPSFYNPSCLNSEGEKLE